MTSFGRPALALVAAAAVLITAGCSGGSTASTPASSTAAATSSSSSTAAGSSASTTPAELTGTLTVFAAASLKNTFTALGTTFQEQHPGTTVTFSFAGSSDLVTQITQGAPADVFASADTNTMQKATDAGVVQGEPVDFATNTLTIVTPPGNPAGITSFADLARPDLAVVVCAVPVPCGSATQKVEDAVGTQLTPVSEEQSVTDVLNKVTSGEADAGLVYLTDARSAGDKVVEVDFPQASAAVNTYPIAALQDTANPELAQAFIDLVTGTDGQQVLATAGFAPAP